MKIKETNYDEKDLFVRMEKLLDQGIIIDCVAVNQVENGYKDAVEAGDIPLVTYTVEVMNVNLDDMLFTEARDSFKEALECGIKAAEQIAKTKRAL